MSSAPKHQARRKLDAYYTPDRLADALIGVLPSLWGTVWEPHIGGGAFGRAIDRSGARLVARLVVSDIDEDAVNAYDLPPDQRAVGDFLDLDWRPEWIIGNPPYSHAEAHVRHALRQSQRHVAFLLRTSFLESAKRIPLWRQHRPRKVWVLSERPSFTADGKTDSASYAWYWWDGCYEGPTSLEVLSWK